MNWEIVNTIVGVIQIIVSLVLIASVLMQSAKKEGMAGIVGGASETFFGKNKGRTLDSKFAVITTVCAIVFLISSLFLSYGMVAIDKANAPQEVVTEDGSNGVQVSTDEEGNLVDAEGNIVMTADEVAQQQADTEAATEGEADANTEGETETPEETPAE